LPGDVLRRLVLLAVVMGACGPALPEPESTGALVLRTRCAACHRLYAPGALTAEMWRVQVARMRPRFAERGMPWLTPGEEQALVDYLTRHAGRS